MDTRGDSRPAEADLDRLLDETLRVLDEMTVSALEVSRALSRSPAASAAVLRAANSAAVGLRHRVSDLAHAVALLGTDQVREILRGEAARVRRRGARPGAGQLTP